MPRYVQKTSRSDYRVLNPPERRPPKFKYGFRRQHDAVKYRDSVWFDPEYEPMSIGWLLCLFEERGFRYKPDKKQLAEKTIQNYRHHNKKLKAMFGHMPIKALREKHLDGMQESMAHKPRECNIRMTVLRAAYRWAVRKDWAERNPMVGFGNLSENAGKKNAVRVHKRITTHQWQNFEALASAELHAYGALMLCTGLAPVDVVKLHRDDISDDGLDTSRHKTGQRVSLSWTDNLRRAVQMALDLPRKEDDGLLLPAATENAWRLRWQKLGKKYLAKYGEKLFTRYSLRVTAGSVAEELEPGTGHKVLANTEKAFKIHYDQSVQRVRGL